MFMTLALLFTASTFNQFTLNRYFLFTTFIKVIKMTPQLMLSHMKMTPKTNNVFENDLPPIKWPTNPPPTAKDDKRPAPKTYWG